MSAESAKLIWSLSNSGLGTTVTASGNSGAWQSPGVPPWTPNALSAIDLRYVEDVWLTVWVAGSVTGTTPQLTVSLNTFDDRGHLFNAYAFTSGGILTASVLSAQVSLGKHGSAANAYLVFSEWGQVSWAIGGTATPTFPGVEISLYGR
jgi:hypothetical protein